MRVLWAQRACAACRQHGPTRSAPWQAPGDKRTVAGRGGAEERGGSEERDDEHHVVHEGRRCVCTSGKSVHHALHRHVHFQPEQENKQNHKGRWGGAKGGKGSGPTPRGSAHRWSSESERGAAPTEHPTRHRARASDMRGFGSRELFSSLPLHCRKNKGDILTPCTGCGRGQPRSCRRPEVWSHEARAQCASLQPAPHGLEDAAAPGQPASFAATHGGSTTDTRRNLSGHRGRGDPKLGRPDGRLHRMHHRSVMYTL